MRRKQTNKKAKRHTKRGEEKKIQPIRLFESKCLNKQDRKVKRQDKLGVVETRTYANTHAHTRKPQKKKRRKKNNKKKKSFILLWTFKMMTVKKKKREQFRMRRKKKKK